MRFGAGPTGPAVGGPPYVLVDDGLNSVAPTAVEYGGGGSYRGQDFLVQLALVGTKRTGSLSYDPANDSIVPNWSASNQRLVEQAAAQSYQKISIATPGSFNTPPLINNRPFTYHPLGGAVMGRVCNDFGQLCGQEHLYVVDGSLLSGSAGMRNPSLMIAAVAERCMDKILQRVAA